MNVRIPICLALALVALTLAPPAPAAAGDLQEVLRSLEQRLLQAIVDHDAEALGRLIGPGFEHTRAVGDRPLVALDAEAWRRVAAGPHGIESFEIHETRVRPIDDRTALAVTRATLTVKLAGVGAESRDSRRLLTSTWLKDDAGAWKVVAQVSAEIDDGRGRQVAAMRESWRWQRAEAGSQPEPVAGTDREALLELLKGRSQREPAAGEPAAGEPAAEEEAAEDPQPGGGG